MSEQLKKLVLRHLKKLGTHGRAKLALAVGVDASTLSRWMKNGVPNARTTVYLALQCGADQDEALRLASIECPSEAAMETA